MKLGGWHPADCVPQTSALGEQKMANFGVGPERFYIEMVQGEQVLGAGIAEEGALTWEQAEQIVVAVDLTAACGTVASRTRVEWHQGYAG